MLSQSQPSEPQTTRYTSHGWFKRNGSSEGPLSRPNAPQTISFPTKLLRRSRRIKTDPLQHVDINSTFDSIAVIQNFIQRESEGQLRQMFREDLPGIIHRLSQQWVKAKVEAPYLNKSPPPATRHFRYHVFDTQYLRYRSIQIVYESHTFSKTSINLRKPSPPTSHIETPSPSSSSHPDLEYFDPTYGLRPEGLPSKSGFKGFSNLFTPNKGLADLAEEESSE